MINAGAGYNLIQLNADVRDLADSALSLTTRVALLKAKIDRVSAAELAALNPAPGTTQERTDNAQKLKDAVGEMAVMSAAYVPIASYDVASANPLRK